MSRRIENYVARIVVSHLNIQGIWHLGNYQFDMYIRYRLQLFDKRTRHADYTSNNWFQRLRASVSVLAVILNEVFQNDYNTIN